MVEDASQLTAIHRGLWFLLWAGVGPLHAQASARFDVTTSNRYVWHGLSRAAGVLLQPSLAVGYQFHGLTLASGLVRHYELDRASPDELSELGSGTGHLGEDNLWGQVDFALGTVWLRSGFARYLFHGVVPQGGSGPLRNTAETYLAVGVAIAYLNPQLEAWWDVDRVKGGFLRASVSSPVMGWPFAPFFFVALDGEVGLNLGQAPDPAQPDNLANFSDRGLTHTALGLNSSFRVRHWPGLGSASINLGLRGQLNLDDATRYDGIGRTRHVIAWLSAGVTLLLGGEARTVR